MTTTETAPATKAKPIIFSGEMVRAILAGKKSQTRRIVKPQPTGDDKIFKFWESYFVSNVDDPRTSNTRNDKTGSFGLRECPYFVGQELWVRETWKPSHPYDLPGQETPIYKADWTDEEFKLIRGETWGWKPSIFMPRWASRITLEVTGVRVERLKSISAADIEAEGIPELDQVVFPSDYSRFQDFNFFWDSINEKRGYNWNSNPWVWVISFKVVQP